MDDLRKDREARPVMGGAIQWVALLPALLVFVGLWALCLVGFVVPFAFGFAALISGQLDTAWFRTTRRWTLFAWLFLSIGIMLGGRWAYEVLGWGGYWAWDPVENASLMPWLTGTAFLHSVMIQEKKGMLKVWNMSRTSAGDLWSRPRLSTTPAHGW